MLSDIPITLVEDCKEEQRVINIQDRQTNTIQLLDMLNIEVSKYQSPDLTDGYLWTNNRLVKVTAYQPSIGNHIPAYVLYLGPKALISKYDRYKIKVEIIQQ